MTSARHPPIVVGATRLRMLRRADLAMTRAWRNHPDDRMRAHRTEPVSETQHAEWYEGYLGRDDEVVFIVEAAGSPVAQVALSRIAADRGSAALGRLLVAPPHRGRGFALAAIELCILAAERLGLRELTLEVRASDERVIRVCERAGFATVRRLGDVLEMVLALEAGPSPHPLLALLAGIAAQQRVEQIDGPAGDWELRDGQLRNRRADFFRVIGRRHGAREEVLIRQEETALVGLLVSGEPGQRRLLLSARAEPGLVGGCQLSATIQSTPSNYERRHGGGATPYMDQLMDPDAVVLHDSLQYDWAQYYDRKVKRFRIVAVTGVEPAGAGTGLWVDERLVGVLSERDHALTCDLRVALALLDIGDRLPAETGESLPTAHPADPASTTWADAPIDGLQDWTLAPEGLRTATRDREVVWVRTRSSTREVSVWEQPLVKVAAPERVALGMRWRAGLVEIALREETRAGLDGRRLWFPVGPSDPSDSDETITVSAEGGRFWRHPVEIAIVPEGSVPGDARWFPLGDAERACLADRETSVELRLAIGLARRRAQQGGAG